MARKTRDAAGVEILYLSSVASPEQFEVMEAARRPGVNAVTYGMPQSGNKFGSLIQAGLSDAPGVRLTALTGRSVHHRFHTVRWWPRVRQRMRSNWVIDHLSFPNLPGARQLWLAKQFALHTLAWRLRTRKSAERVFIADAAYVTALPGVLAALAGSNVKKVAIFADVYRYMGTVADASDRGGLVVNLVRKLARASYAQLDGLVLLTEQMNPVVNPARRPHIVMEGLVDAAMAEKKQTPESKDGIATVLYAGALRVEYGLRDLVTGFQALTEPARLVIYGDGDYAPELREISATDPRIEFRGNVPVAEVVAAEQRAWLLVNPRPAGQEFTKFSFPSKNMEYLAAGTAVLSTRLPGMPTEYYEYVMPIEDGGAQAITAALSAALAQGRDELHERGQRGKQFVLTKKNNRHQAKRILDFARGL